MIFKQLSTKTGLAFVVIHHVRNVPTLLPELLSAWTEMPVALGVEGESACPNSAYVLPSDIEITLSDGSFAMRPQTKRREFSNVHPAHVLLAAQDYAQIMRSAIAVNGSFFNTQCMVSQALLNAYGSEREGAPPETKSEAEGSVLVNREA